MSFGTFLSGRVKKVSGSELDSDRKSYIDLKNVEPDLGNPATNNEILLSDATGERYFGKLGTGLTWNAVSGSIEAVFDSAQVVGVIQTVGFDSAAAIDLIDSAYVQARQSYDADTLDGLNGSYYLDYTNFTNTPNILDSADVSGIILNDVDSAYVTARAFDQSLNTTDSAVFAGLTVGNYTFPTTDGTAGYALVTDGAGNISFSVIDAGVDSASILDILSNGSVDTINFTDSAAVLSWNDVDATLDVAYANGTTLQLGQETHIYAKATESISNGDVVMFAGAQGDHLLIAKADPTVSGFIDEWVIGVATQDFALNAFGYVTTFGKVRELDTSTPGWSEGDILYLDPLNPGGLTSTIPAIPYTRITVAAVVRVNANVGEIFVRPTMHSFLNNLNDVYIENGTGVQTGQLLVWDGVQQRWENDDTIRVDATNGNVGIGVDPSYSLDVDSDVRIGGVLYGPSTFYIDPAPIDSDAGTLVIRGNLQIDGTTTTVNSTTVSVNDKNIVLADNAANASEADLAGITVNGANATILYKSASDTWEFNKAPYFGAYRVLTTADEGTGNGLDADTLDGIQGASFLRSDAADSKTSGDLTFVDGIKAIFGTGSDLQVYHDGVNSYVSDVGVGNLYVQGTNLYLRNGAGTQTYAIFSNTAGTTLYHNGSQRFATTTGGIDVSGNITLSGTVDGRDVATDGTKLDTIETNAKDDQTITAGAGLTGGGTGDVTLNVGAGTGITVNANDISVDLTGIDHDQLLNFVANEHIDHSAVSIIAGNGLTGGGDLTQSRTLTVGQGTGITVGLTSISTNDSQIVHDNLSGFVANEHIDHSAVSIIAGDGIAGGGDLTTSRTLSINAGTGITVDSDGISTNDGQIVHDNLSGFVANEHINHSSVNLTAGAGLTGGGDITASRTFNVGAGTGITVAADSISVNESAVNHDNLLGFVANEHVDHSSVVVTAGNGLTGGGDIASSFTINVGAGTGITVDSDTISVNEGTINHDNLLGFVANEHINHSSVTLTAGAGLTGGGDITASRTFNIGAGTGITVDSDSISVNEGAINHDNLLGFVANEHINHTSVSITAGAGLTGGGDISASRTINVGAGTGISVAADSISVNPAQINHDALQNFVADEHVAHSGVTMTAGAGLTGGGTIAASRTFNVGAGTGVTVSADAVSIGQDVATTADVTFATVTTTGNVTIGGNLQVTGTTTTINTQSLDVSDNMIYMNAGESDGSPTQSVDVGWAANVNDDGTYTHVGMFRDATDNRFKVFGAYTPEPDAAVEIDTSHASFALADFQAATVYASLSGNATTASTLQTARTISLTGDVTGSTSFNGGSNVSITATVADNSHNHTTGNITGFTEAVQDIIGADVIGGGAITVSYNDTTGDTTISHTDTSTQASVDNSNGTVIQDISLDTYGHITGIGSVDLDSRYYTETEADSRFVNVTGDTMTGSLVINANDASLTLNDTSGSPTDQGIRIRAESIDVNLPGGEGLGIIFEESPTNGSPDTTPAVITTGEFYAQSNQKVFHDNYHPNADKWTTARTLSLTGDVTGSASIDGSGNVSLTTTVASVSSSPTLTINGDASGSATFTNLADATLTLTIADDSHNHVISNVDGLQTALDAKADETITISAGAGLTGGGDLTANRTISHADTSTQASVNNSNGTVIQDITLDTYGHITAIGSANLDSRYYTETEADSLFVSLAGDTMTGNLVVSSSGTIGISNPANGYVQVTDGTNTMAFDPNEIYSTSDIVLTAAGGNVNIGSTSNRVFADDYHPNADKWTTARTLSLTGAVTGSVSIDGSGNVSLATTATSDPTLTINGDASGSATFTNLGNATLTLTIADDSHNHVISNVDGLQAALDAKLNASAYTAADVLSKILTVDGAGSLLDADLLDGQQGSYYLDYNNLTNVPNAAAVNDNTITISPGTNMTGGGSFTVNQNFNETITISHADTSAQSSVNNSNGTVIQDITLDGNGHVTGIGSVDLDSRYVNVTGDTMTGNLTLSNSNLVMNDYTLNSQTTTLATVTQTQIAAFTAATYGSAEVLITAKTGVNRHITKLLIVHDGTTASATEFGKVVTAGDLASYEVDISGGNVRILATSDSATSTVYKVALTLMEA